MKILFWKENQTVEIFVAAMKVSVGPISLMFAIIISFKAPFHILHFPTCINLAGVSSIVSLKEKKHRNNGIKL